MHRRATAQDFDFFYHLYMHPLINLHLLYEMMPKDEFRPIFQDLLAHEELYVFQEEDQLLGMFKLTPSKHRTGHLVYLGGIAIHPDHWGQGYGLRMIKEIIDLCIQRGFLRIELSVGISNEKAKKLYLKAGFEEEGILRKFTYLKSQNLFIDEILMSYLMTE